jgi:AraC-like DNA-binding protein
MKVENAKKTRPAGSNSASNSGGERTTFWRSSVLTGVEFFKATFSDHVYSRHTHSEYAIGVTERGAQVFNCRGAARLAAPSSFSLINPEEPHDGRSATGHDYTYRMIYVDPEALLRLSDRNGVGMQSSSQFPLFLSPIVEDPILANDYLRLHQGLEAGSFGRLETESRMLALLTALVTRHADQRVVAPTKWYSPIVRSIREYLEAHFHEDPSLSELSEVTGMNRFSLLRQFTREVGLPPHGYLTQVRLRAARVSLLAGRPPALVAAEVGFVDQSHLIKRFRSAFGITPGQYVSAELSR